jgi:hypothetical protein
VHETCSMGQGSFHLPLSLPTRSTWQPVCNNCPGWYSVKESTRGRRGITCHVYMPRLQKEARKKEEEKHISFLKVVQRYGITASPRHHTPWPTPTPHTLPPHTPPHHHTTTPPHHHNPISPTFPYLGPKGRHWPRCVCLVLWRLCWCQRTGAVFSCPVHNGPRGT